MLSLLLLIAADAREDAFAELPLFHRQTYIESVSEEMHWFAAGFHDVERAGCRVGIPVEEGLEPIIGCYFPAGVGENVRPQDPDLRDAWRAARREVRQANPRARSIRLSHVGTWTEIAVSDVVPRPAGNNPHVSRIYGQGHARFALTEEGIERAPFVGMMGLGGLGLAPQALGDWHFLEVPADSSLAGRSVLRNSWVDEPSPALKAAEEELMAAVIAALPAHRSGERTGPRLQADTVLPEGIRTVVAGHLSIYARPLLNEHGMYARQQQSTSLDFAVPLDVALHSAVEWTEETDHGLTVRYAIDLPSERASFEATATTGETVSASWAVQLDLLRDGERLWPLTVESTQTDKLAPLIFQVVPLRENQLQLPAEGWRALDLYADGPGAVDEPWQGPGTYTITAQ